MTGGFEIGVASKQMRDPLNRSLFPAARALGFKEPEAAFAEAKVVAVTTPVAQNEEMGRYLPLPHPAAEGMVKMP